jgi:hypothetical protein
MRRLATWVIGFTIVTSLSLVADAQSAVPDLLPLDGYAADSKGVGLDGPHLLDIRLFRVATGGTAVFGEQQKNVNFDHGSFSVDVGKANTLDLGKLTAMPQLFLELSIDGDLIEPRFQVGSVPYAGFALASGDAQTLTGMPPTAFAAATHSHAFADLTSVPAGFSDGEDNDSFAKLSCTSGKRPQKSASGWDCTPVSADEISGGTLSTSVYSAYADLQDESRLDGTSASDILTRAVGDTRYMSGTLVNTAFQISAGSNQTQSTPMDGFRFCALTGTQVSGGGSCTVTPGVPGSFTLAASAGMTQNATCKAICF